ncbi:terminase small subunit [Enterococcus faecium]|jgi:phage terminase small subunit|nr:terminase small subunit [Enterococcus faecium]DAP81951.1 MAG TPA: Terminase small subunit [Caudoviricetes sp.]
MSKLNPKQQAFADEYIITGNAYQSALKAGYKENYAKNAQEKLVEKGGKVSDYIQEKLKEVQAKRHLTMEEALAITASIAKGEPQRFEVVKRDPYTNEIIEREVSEYSAGFKERNQALEHYYKINAAFVDKQKVEISEIPTFIDDISSDDDG